MSIFIFGRKYLFFFQRQIAMSINRTWAVLIGTGKFPGTTHRKPVALKTRFEIELKRTAMKSQHRRRTPTLNRKVCVVGSATVWHPSDLK
ncbi:hypothetical protein BG46_20685 [Brucella anthropi]|nr:hypothetical protein BG46_20685 [Brucella anthropi]PQZ63881.1 hypothetical protein CQ057_21305 [Ochrobactrum sp. MYb49]